MRVRFVHATFSGLLKEYPPWFHDKVKGWGLLWDQSLSKQLVVVVGSVIFSFSLSCPPHLSLSLTLSLSRSLSLSLSRESKQVGSALGSAVGHAVEHFVKEMSTLLLTSLNCWTCSCF